MAITINGTGSITGLTAGGLPDGSITSADLASGAITAGALPTGSILQVVQTTKTDTYTTNSASWVTPTDLSVNITPSTTSSKILIFATVALAGQTGYSTAMARLRRGSNVIYAGDSGPASGMQSYGQFYTADNGFYSIPVVGIYLDSPGVDTQITYDIQVRSQSTSGTVYVNRTQADRNAAGDSRTVSSITVMEVAA